jgi:hypothetical protein
MYQYNKIKNNYNKFDDYQETDDMKNLTNKELFQLQKDKINSIF